MADDIRAILQRARLNFADGQAALGELEHALDLSDAGKPVLVKSGDNLPSLLAAAPAGQVFSIDPAFVHVGDIEFKKPCTLQSSAFLPTPRVGKDAPFPQINGHHVIRSADVTFRSILQNGTNKDRTNLIEVYGDRFTFDRSVALGHPNGQTRGINLIASRGSSVIKSHIGGIYYQGNGDTQAIGSTRDCHDLLVDDSLLEAAGEVFILGGGDIGSDDRMCSDIIVRNSTLTKRLEWRALRGVAKNILEIKAARRVTIQNNALSNSWVDGQTGFGIVLTVRNQYNRDPFATIEDVLIADNTLTGVAGGVSILGIDNSRVKNPDGSNAPATGRVGTAPGDTFASERMKRVTIRNLAIADISRHTWGWNGRTVQIIDGPEDLTLEGWTVAAGAHRGTDLKTDGNHAVSHALIMDGTPTTRLVMRGGFFEEGDYGVQGGGLLGIAGLEKQAPGYAWETMTIKRGGARTIKYPVGTTFAA